MDKRKVRIGVISTGVISALALVLYLPVLIWSPPWGEDGYYTPISNDCFVGPDKDDFRTIELNGKKLVIQIKLNGITEHESSFDLLNDGDLYHLFEKTINTNCTRSLKYVDNTFIITTLWIGQKSNQSVYERITNPFTLWYIKWLEWTAE